MYHKSVLLKETIDNLNIKEDGIYVDATLGFAGHSSEILKRIPKGHLYAIDQDEFAINYSKEKLSKISNNFTIIKDNFSNLKNVLKNNNVTKIDGILFDLGVSSYQLDEQDRGFSFHKDAKLDMRMDTTKDFSAYNVVNEYPYQDLVRILREYGEEKYATSIAHNIVKYREEKNIETTLELVDIIKKSMPYKAMKEHHPARKTFQAIRIEVNQELEVLKTALEFAIELTKKGGRICVITFHSLEDRIVKTTFKKYSEIDNKIKNLPYIPEEYEPILKTITNIKAGREELDDNYRSHSARLRVSEKLKD